LITIVTREFSEWQPFLPRTLARDKASSKNVLKNLIHMLNLPRCLWMISRTTD
jgi:alpha-D-ribose 1-methylphosphonate 5-triphosphate synthase subunit PhnL